MEHVCLLKAKQSLLSEEKEKDMLDYLYTSQYQMRGIVAISVGEPLSTLLVLCVYKLKTKKTIFIDSVLLSQVALVIKTVETSHTLSLCGSRGRKTLRCSMRTLSS